MKLKADIKKILYYSKWIYSVAKSFTWPVVAILVMDSVGAIVGVVFAILSKNLIDNAVNGALGKAMFYAAVFGIIVLANLGIRAFSSVLSVRTVEALSNSLRKRMFERYTKTEWAIALKYHSGDVMTRLTSDVGTIASCVVDTFPGIVSLSVQLLAAFATLLYYEPTLAILAFVLGPFTVLFSRIWGRKIKCLHKKVQESESAYRSFLQESLENILIVKSFRLENQSLNTISNLHNNRMEWVMKKNKTSVVAGTVLGLGYWIGYFLAFCWGAFRLNSGVTTFGTLTAFLQLVSQVQGPFVGLSRTLPQVVATIACAGRLIELESLDIEVSMQNIPPCTKAGVQFERVTYSYSNSQPTLEKLCANIHIGETVAVVGPSGEGKTTLIRVLLALLKPSSGSAFLIGEDGTKYMVSAETRDWISYVPQGNTLFSGTILDNIRAGCNDATDTEIEAALKAACALEFVNELPDGINTVIGERGIGLSEGQAQRIAIARAFVRKTPILILDEATSALDMNSEMLVLRAIKEMNSNRTCIVITHRPSALSICSRVLKLHNGNLIEVAIDATTSGCAVSA